MPDISAKFVLAQGVKVALSQLAKKLMSSGAQRVEKRVKITEAVIAIQKATIETKKFVQNNGFIASSELTDLWHKALNACVAADLTEHELPDYLYRKAEFWGNPDEWLNNQASLELVPQLTEMKRLCDNLMTQLGSV